MDGSLLRKLGVPFPFKGYSTLEGRMTRKFKVIGGPSREDLFDCLRLANRRSRLFPVQFKVEETEYPLILFMIQSLECTASQFVDDRINWVIRSESAHIVEDFKTQGDTEMFTPYKVKIVYNTKTRRGTAYVTRMRSKN